MRGPALQQSVLIGEGRRALDAQSIFESPDPELFHDCRTGPTPYFVHIIRLVRLGTGV